MDFLYQFLDDQVVFALSWAVLHSLWQALLIMILVRLGINSGLVRQAHTRYKLAFSGLLAILLAFAGTIYHYYEPAGTTTLYLAPTMADSAAFAEWIPTPLSWWQRFELTVSTYQHITASLWLLGFSGFLLRMIGGLWYVQGIKRRYTLSLPPEIQGMAHRVATRLGMQHTPPVMASAHLSTPAVIGWIKPVILFPAALVNQLSTKEMEAILAHELAHVIRQDYLLNILQTVAEAMLYFNPAVWYLSAIIRREREHCCDDLAIKACGNPLEYAKALLRLEEIILPAPALAMGLKTGQGALLHRITRILQPDIKSNSMEKTIIIGLFMALLFSFSVQATERSDAGFNATTALMISHDSVPKTIIKRIIENKNGQQVETQTENGRLTALKINGKDIPASEWSAYQELIPKEENEPEMVSVFVINKSALAPGDSTKVGIPSKAIYIVDGIRMDSPDMLPIDNIEAIEVLKDGPATAAYGLSGNNNVVIITTKSGKKQAPLEVPLKTIVRNYYLQADSLVQEKEIIELFGNARIMEFNAEDMVDKQLQELIRQAIPDSLGVFISPSNLQKTITDEVKVVRGTWVEERLVGNNNVQTALEKEMLRDGLLKQGAGYKLELGHSSMKVNGKKMPEGLARKYQQIYESKTGISIVKGSRILLHQ
jgi:bla regulator protein blaR1